jgi:NAD(P)-dependent dehydrogenase (short-subunit alcohol dehydrogenase family)
MSSMNNRFDGKVALITGAATGIGAATAQRIVAEGGKVVLLDLSDKVHETAAALKGKALVGNALDADLLEQAVGVAQESFGGLDVLIPAAGTPIMGGLETIEYDVWKSTLDLHLDGAFKAAKAAMPAMRARGGGAIVLVSSLGGLMAAGQNIAYTTAKTGLLAMNRSLAVDYGREGIRCNAVCPGLVETPLTDTLFQMLKGGLGYDKQEAYDRLVKFMPLGRFGQPSEIAAAIAFLASDDAAFMTGSVLTVDGGSHIVECGFANLAP